MTVSQETLSRFIQSLKSQSFASDTTLDLEELTGDYAPEPFLPGTAPNQEDAGEESRRVTFFGTWLFERLTGEFPNGVESLSDVKPGLYNQGLSDFLDRCLGLGEKTFVSFDQLEAALKSQSFAKQERDRVPPGQLQGGWLFRILAGLLDSALIVLVSLLWGAAFESVLIVWLTHELLLVPLFQSSLGMRLLQLEFREAGQRSPSVGRLFLRGLVKTMGILFFAVTYGWPLLRAGRRPLHEDLLDLRLMHRRSS